MAGLLRGLFLGAGKGVPKIGGRPELDLVDVSRQLEEIDESSIAELLAFKQSLENNLRLYCEV